MLGTALLHSVRIVISSQGDRCTSGYTRISVWLKLQGHTQLIDTTILSDAKSNNDDGGNNLHFYEILV